MRSKTLFEFSYSVRFRYTHYLDEYKVLADYDSGGWPFKVKHYKEEKNFLTDEIKEKVDETFRISEDCYEEIEDIIDSNEDLLTYEPERYTEEYYLKFNGKHVQCKIVFDLFENEEYLKEVCEAISDALKEEGLEGLPI